MDREKRATINILLFPRFVFFNYISKRLYFFGYKILFSGLFLLKANVINISNISIFLKTTVLKYAEAF